ncbi:MAG TPA: DUF6434 domain-containing protein [Propioniciclava sp.]|uniref:DUF6434 domain-containing protein n=1 Tax=Propioniciclava sp. TaxID=2038686 RepID=UPI002C78B62A|nr:DUF6434 domain-containing protein [Propioniciclava sp.]HRL50096.1 DUF6434 domain-containing protein [Propioniciclava sp.]HRL79563.1 DUF6434 domain-containing protein [Propioniciclava sp.]
MTSPKRRPTLSPDMSGAELRRWYWLRNELVDFARTLGVTTTGTKTLLTQRLAHALDGVPSTEPARTRQRRTAALSGSLTAQTVIPSGQRCSQPVRAWFTDQVGPGFRFDAPMREFFARSDGSTTLGDALEHYRSTREPTERSIDPQFEYNRFTRAWYSQHPGGSRDALLVAWARYRDRPVDERGRA